MSRKISDYFKIQPKVDENVSKSLNICDCKVDLSDIKNQAGKKELKIFEEVSLSDSQNKKSKGKKEKIRCPICNIKLVQKNLELYMKAKHPDGQAEQFECDIDGKIFKRKKHLYRHMFNHLPLVKCQLCDKMLKIKFLNDHLNNVHAANKKFQCKICQKSFKSAKYLHYHEKIHNKTIECDICRKVFSFANKLKQHKNKYHENAKSFECEICDKKFNQKSNLTAHQKTHDKNRPKPFKCQRCNFAFNIQQNFKKHQQSHDRKDKIIAAMKNPIKCEKCPKFCKDKTALRIHVKHVHPKDLFQCDLCAKFIKNKHNLVKHLRIHIPKL